ncbi:hypothetical protein EXIGLDRAFT_406274 [Exidia glandulosa HHB12029]|uniref:Uncharacterized protein n=1 Tax=Exidia glandulosa HHB12029 TaxID=1314781 RepID=A0A165BIV9_EXIGL|nr:hypothetical protein EXIGLDRAFT_406274 [Exidia glandulosa HHB12029]
MKRMATRWTDERRGILYEWCAWSGEPRWSTSCHEISHDLPPVQYSIAIHRADSRASESERGHRAERKAYLASLSGRGRNIYSIGLES